MTFSANPSAFSRAALANESRSSTFHVAEKASADTVSAITASFQIDTAFLMAEFLHSRSHASS